VSCRVRCPAGRARGSSGSRLRSHTGAPARPLCARPGGRCRRRPDCCIGDPAERTGFGGLEAIDPKQLNRHGHDAVSVYELDLAGTEDADVFSRAVADDPVLVTENFADHSLLLRDRLRADEPCVPVVFVHRPDFASGGALAVHLTD
jgi:hypothetical protein